MNMPDFRDRRTQIIAAAIVGFILFVALLGILIGMLVRSLRVTPRPVLPVVNTVSPLPTQAPLATPTVVPPTTNPNDFSGDWIFQKFDGKEQSGIYKGHDIGLFVSKDNPADTMHATCDAPLSPAPNKGDVFWWDPNTNIIVPYISEVPKGTVQRFRNPHR